MKSQLIAALRSQHGPNTSSDVDALQRLAKKQALNQLSSTLKTSHDISALLDDPMTPSDNDLNRWWPEARQSIHLPSPLVAFPTVGSAHRRIKIESAARPQTTPTSVLGGRASSAARGPRPATVNMARSSSSAVALERGMAPAASIPAFGMLKRSASGVTLAPTKKASSISSPASRSRRPGTASSVEPSRNYGDPTQVDIPVSPRQLNAFTTAAQLPSPRRQLEILDRDERLSHWMKAFAADEEIFKSKAVSAPCT